MDSLAGHGQFHCGNRMLFPARLHERIVKYRASATLSLSADIIYFQPGIYRILIWPAATLYCIHSYYYQFMFPCNFNVIRHVQALDMHCGRSYLQFGI